MLAAREEAVEELLASLVEPPRPGLEPIGLPTAEEAIQLGQAMAQKLWREPAAA